jgi:hypothetical protein
VAVLHLNKTFSVIVFHTNKVFLTMNLLYSNDINVVINL